MHKRLYCIHHFTCYEKLMWDKYLCLVVVRPNQCLHYLFMCLYKLDNNFEFYNLLDKYIHK